ncbi:hypothetical protein HG530_003266 [Fusarium avenaceum]|nr:hypothetical protein HG530_003266 [Fusarium avenaceum]
MDNHSSPRRSVNACSHLTAASLTAADSDRSASGTLPVSVQRRENLLCLELFGQEVKTVNAAFPRVIVQFGFSRLVRNLQNSVEISRKHVGKMLSKSADESVTGNVKFFVTSILLQTFIKVLDCLGNCARQHGYDGVLKNIHERGKAQKCHNSEALLRLAKAVLASNCGSCSNNSLDVFLAILLGNLVHTGDSSVLVPHVGRLSNTGSKLGKECQQDRSGCRIGVALLVNPNLESAENLLSQTHVGSVKQVLNSLDELSDRQQVEVVGKSLSTAAMKILTRLDRVSQNKNVLEQASNLCPELLVGQKAGEGRQLTESNCFKVLILVVLVIANAQENKRNARPSSEQVSDQVEKLDECVELCGDAEMVQQLDDKLQDSVTGTVSIDQHADEGMEEVLGAESLDEGNK